MHAFPAAAAMQSALRPQIRVKARPSVVSNLLTDADVISPSTSITARVALPHTKGGVPGPYASLDAVRRWMLRHSLTDVDAAHLISLPLTHVQQWLSGPMDLVQAEAAIGYATAYLHTASRAPSTVVPIPVRFIPPASDLLRSYRVYRLADGTDAIAAAIAAGDGTRLSQIKTVMLTVQQAFTVILRDDDALAAAAATPVPPPPHPAPALVSFDAWGQHITSDGVCERAAPLDAAATMVASVTAGGDMTPCIDAAYLVASSDSVFRHARGMPASPHVRAFMEVISIMQLSTTADAAVQRSHDKWDSLHAELRRTVAATIARVQARPFHPSAQAGAHAHISICVDQLDVLLQLCVAVSTVAMTQPGDAVRGIVCTALAALIELWEDMLSAAQSKYCSAHVDPVIGVLRAYVIAPVHARAATALQHARAMQLYETWIHLLLLLQNRCILFASCTWRAANVVSRGGLPHVLASPTYILLALRNLTNMFPTPFRLPPVTQT